jgi:hypothetical protein
MFAHKCGDKTVARMEERLLRRFGQEGSMPDAKFTDEEVAAFVKWFRKTPTWSYWRRVSGEHGEDVLEVGLGGKRHQTLKLARSARFGYMVAGFDGWGLTVCDEFSELLAILSCYRPRPAVESSDPEALSLTG